MFEFIYNKLLDLLVDSLWIGVVCWLFLWIALKVIGVRFARIRYHFSLLVFLVLFLVLFMVVFSYDSIYAVWLKPKVMVLTNYTIAKESFDFSVIDRLQLFIIANNYYLGLFWLFGVIVYAIKYSNQSSAIKNIQESGISDYGLQKLKVDLIDALGIKKEISVRFMRNGSHPFTIGYMKPIIYFPVQAVTGFSSEELELILFHELVHIKRNDYLINMIQLWIEIIFFFNPFIRQISKMIKNEREASCDYSVINHGYPKIAYAKALERSYEMHYNLALHFGSNNVFSRIKNLTDYKRSDRKTKGSTKILNVFIVSVFVIGTLGFGVSAKTSMSDVEIISLKETTIYPRIESRNDTTVFKIDEHRALYKYKDSLVGYTVDGIEMRSELLNFEKRKEDKGEYIEFSIVHKISGEIIERSQKIKESDWRIFMRSLRDQCLMKNEGSMVYISPFGDMYIDDHKLPEAIQKKNASLIREEIPFSPEAIAFAKEMIVELQKNKLVDVDFDKVRVVFQPIDGGVLLLNGNPLSKRLSDKYIIYLKKIRGKKLYNGSKYIIK